MDMDSKIAIMNLFIWKHKITINMDSKIFYNESVYMKAQGYHRC